MVLSDTVLLRIAIPNTSRSTAYCSFDGKGRVELRQGDSVTVEASQYPFPTVLSGPGEWFESVRRALRWNMRGAVQKGWCGDVKGLDHEGHHIDAAEGNIEQWDIDTDSGGTGTGIDSAIGASEDGESPLGRQMSFAYT